LSTELKPEALLAELQRIETALGRVRTEHWGPRTVDLDLLLYDQATRRTPELTLPHPLMASRRFVLAPAAETAPWMIHPEFGWTVARLLQNLEAEGTAQTSAPADLRSG
jgi:7,8-dihydro-6-hydroxymethylpterin-pyrophosphokinase